MKLALFDIDGVLADDRHRVQYALERDWPNYFNKHRMFQDDLWPEGVSLLRQKQEEGWEIGYLTGRRRDLYWTLVAWLATKDLPLAEEEFFFMRPVGKKVPLANLKVEILQKLIASGKFEEVVLFDDDPEVIRLVQEKLGYEYASHCTWHIKETALVKKAAI